MENENPRVPPVKAISGLSCPVCCGTEVAQLPPNGISRRPGYRCLSCGARMRGMTGMYVFVIVLGLALSCVAAGLVHVFGDIRDEKIRDLVRVPAGPWSFGLGFPLYLGLVAYSARELFRPSPRRG